MRATNTRIVFVNILLKDLVILKSKAEISEGHKDHSAYVQSYSAELSPVVYPDGKEIDGHREIEQGTYENQGSKIEIEHAASF